MNYQQTLAYLNAQLPMFHRVGGAAYKANLDNTLALCNLLENPQHSFKSIHVTGTNGKGSVSHMLASILQTHGFRTGLYTSPHLKDFRERIRVNGKKIPVAFVNAFIRKHKEDFGKIQPSFFEMTVGMAFQFFKEQQVEIAIIEVGLGGRLDSTNIITPLVSVITNVSFDHMQFLGNSLEKIAREKAGIIKPGIPVIIGETHPETKDIFLQEARKSKSAILFADQHYSSHKINWSGKQNWLVADILCHDEMFIPHLASPLGGNYQLKNILTVIACCQALNDQGIPVSKQDICYGIRHVITRTGLLGRWQIICREPLTICDTGHNPGGLKEVLSQIASVPHQHLHFIFGVVNDKDLNPILGMLPRTATYYFCKPDIPRGLDSGELKHKAHKAGLTGQDYTSVQAALAMAQQTAGPDDLVFVGGSTFVVAEVL